MNVQKVFKYSINYLDVMKNDEYMMIARCRILNVDEDNCWHTIFSEEDIIRCLPTLANKPVLAIYKDSIFKSDFTDHARNKNEKKKIKVFGVIPETNEAKIVTVGNRKYLECIICFWKYYNEEMVNKIAENSKNGKDTKVSMEIMINEDTCEELEDGCIRVRDFKFMCICCLGENYTPAMNDASISVLKYSKTDYNKALKQANKVMKEYSTKEDTDLQTEEDVKLDENVKNETYSEKETEKEEEKETSEETREDAQEHSEDRTSEEEKKEDETKETSEEEKKEDETKETSEEEKKEEEDTEHSYAELQTMYSALVQSNSELKEKFKETLSVYNKLEEDYCTLESDYKKISEEVVNLREFKFSKEREVQDAHAKEVFAKYEKYFEDDEEGKIKAELKEILYSKGTKEFNKEVSAYVLPKIEAENILFQQQCSADMNKVFQYSMFPKVDQKPKEVETPKDSFGRLKQYIEEV